MYKTEPRPIYAGIVCMYISQKQECQTDHDVGEKRNCIACMHGVMQYCFRVSIFTHYTEEMMMNVLTEMVFHVPSVLKTPHPATIIFAVSIIMPTDYENFRAKDRRGKKENRLVHPASKSIYARHGV